jgi:hypothetical protein
LLLAIATAPKLPKHEGKLLSAMGKNKITASSSTVASATGPKATGAAQKPAAAKYPQCDWTGFTITNSEEKRMWSPGLISSNKKDVQFPGSDSRPIPLPDSSLCSLPICSVGYLFKPTNFSDAPYSPTASTFGC